MEQVNESKTIRVSTVIIAIATVVNVIVAYLMWQITSSNVEITEKFLTLENRPFIGTQKIFPEIDKKNKIFTHNIVFKNFGSIPAKHVKLRTEIYFDDKLKSGDMDTSKAESILFPGVTANNDGGVYDNFFDSVFVYNKLYKVRHEITYFGPNNKRYHTVEMWDYSKKSNSFILVDGWWD